MSEVELNYPTEDELLAMHTTPFSKAKDETIHLWYWYAGEALATIPSNWKKSNSTRANTPLHEAMTVSDEAFIITVIVHYKDKFKEAYKTPRKARAGRRKGEAQWSDEMIKQFAKSFDKVQEARKNKNAPAWEKAFSDYYKGFSEAHQDNKDSHDEEEEGKESDMEIPMDDLE